jgi:hypothetical protein
MEVVYFRVNVISWCLVVMGETEASTCTIVLMVSLCDRCNGQLAVFVLIVWTCCQ